MIYALCTVILALASASTVALHGSGCPCPEKTTEWTVYPDSSRGAPDFFSERSIQIREVIVCDRALHLRFRAAQSGEEREICLVVAEPTYADYLARMFPDSVMTDEDADRVEASVQWERAVYAERMTQVKALFRNQTNGDRKLAFKTGWLRRPPTIRPGKPLLLQYKGRTIELVGMFDVFFER